MPSPIEMRFQPGFLKSTKKKRKWFQFLISVQSGPHFVIADWMRFTGSKMNGNVYGLGRRSRCGSDLHFLLLASAAAAVRKLKFLRVNSPGRESTWHSSLQAAEAHLSSSFKSNENERYNLFQNSFIIQPRKKKKRRETHATHWRRTSPPTPHNTRDTQPATHNPQRANSPTQLPRCG